MKTGGIVLCGGKSSRMGQPKPLLPFGPELMLQRVVRLLSEVVSPLVIVAATDQSLPVLPSGVLLARDEHPERGPLEGLAAGLRTIAPHAEAAYVTGCDVPLLQPGFVREMIALLGSYDIVVPVDNDRVHPLAGVYRTTVLEHILDLLAQDQLKLMRVFDKVSTLQVSVDRLRSVDPELQSLMNLNYPADYEAALEVAGFGGTAKSIEKPKAESRKPG